MRLRPEQHLRRQSDIRAVREQGSRTDCRAFTVWSRLRDAVETFSPKPALARPRIGVVASTAAVGKAVSRNRAKRRLREVFRRNQHLLPVECDLLLVSRAATTRWLFSELENRFIEACRLITKQGKHV